MIFCNWVGYFSQVHKVQWVSQQYSEITSPYSNRSMSLQDPKWLSKSLLWTADMIPTDAILINLQLPQHVLHAAHAAIVLWILTVERHRIMREPLVDDSKLTRRQRTHTSSQTNGMILCLTEKQKETLLFHLLLPSSSQRFNKIFPKVRLISCKEYKKKAFHRNSLIYLP